MTVGMTLSRMAGLMPTLGGDFFWDVLKVLLIATEVAVDGNDEY